MSRRSLLGMALILFALPLLAANHGFSAEQGLKRLTYNNPSLVVDLGVGLWAWPLPMDFDHDGDLDLVVACPDKPYNGVYFFENGEGRVKYPVFRPARRIGRGLPNVSPSYIDKKVHILSPALEYPNFRKTGLERGSKLPVGANIHPNRVRANQWKYLDYDGDGRLDVLVNSGNANLLRQVANRDGTYLFRDMGKLDPRSVSGHSTSPTVVDWNSDGVQDLLVGAEDGHLYYRRNLRTKSSPPPP